MNTKFMKMKTLGLSAFMLASLALPVWADGQAAAKDSETTIPVYITSNGNTFDVTVPTSFPTQIDADTGESIDPDNLVITNNSSGSIVVSKIVAKNHGDWSLDSYDADLRNADVDSNLIGISVQPKGGRNSTTGTVLKTDNSSKTEQTLLASKSSEWVIDASDGATGGKDELQIVYSTNASPTSQLLANEQVASILITVGWNVAE